MHRVCTKWENEAFSPFTFPSFIRQNLLKRCIGVTACKAGYLTYSTVSCAFPNCFGFGKWQKLPVCKPRLWSGFGLIFRSASQNLLLLLGTHWAHCHRQGEFTESSICNPTLHCHMLCCPPSHHFPASGVPLCWTCCPVWRQQGAAAQLYQGAPRLDSSVGVDRQAGLTAGPHVK